MYKDLKNIGATTWELKVLSENCPMGSEIAEYKSGLALYYVDEDTSDLYNEPYITSLVGIVEECLNEARKRADFWVNRYPNEYMKCKNYVEAISRVSTIKDLKIKVDIYTGRLERISRMHVTEMIDLLYVKNEDVI